MGKLIWIPIALVGIAALLMLGRSVWSVLVTIRKARIKNGRR
jgi:hypothetical protein